MSNTSHRFKDFSLSWTRGRTLVLDLDVTRTIAGETEPEILNSGEVLVIGKRALADDDSEALFQLSIANGGVLLVTPEEGAARATITPEHTQGLADGSILVFVDCVRVTSGGEVYSFQKGLITFHTSGKKSFG